MARSGPGPLTTADYNTINKELQRQEMIRQQIELAAQAGIPCAEMDEACKALREQIGQIKKVYFPDRP